MTTQEIRAATMADIRQEISRARKLYPDNTRNLEVLQHFAEALGLHLRMSQGSVGQHIEIRTDAISIAVMAIRIIEEGSGDFKYWPNGHKRTNDQTTLFDRLNEHVKPFLKCPRCRRFECPGAQPGVGCTAPNDLTGPTCIVCIHLPECLNDERCPKRLTGS